MAEVEDVEEAEVEAEAEVGDVEIPTEEEEVDSITIKTAAPITPNRNGHSDCM